MDILDIISNSLLRPLDAKEQELLDRWLAEDERHRLFYQAMLSKEDLTDSYETYMGFDEQKAWGDIAPRLEDGNKQTKHKLHLSYINYARRAAAVIAGVMLLTGAYLLFHPRPAINRPVAVSQEIASAMQKAESSPVNEATIQVGSGKPQQVSSAAALLKVISQKDLDEDIQGTVTTLRDKEFWTTLPDGTRVHLNGNSRISYPMAFKGDLREVALVGEAYFIVAKDKAHPFIVHTCQGDVKEYGTEFNVSARGEQTQVVLVRGSISVKGRGGKEQMMQPGDKAEMSAQGTALSRVDVAPYIAWNTGQFSFDDCTLEDLMQVIGRWYGREVVFTSDRLRKIRFAGSLSRYESIDNTLDVIGTIANVKVEQQDNKIIIQ